MNRDICHDEGRGMASKPLGTRYLSDMVHQARILGPNAPGGSEKKHVALPRPS